MTKYEMAQIKKLCDNPEFVAECFGEWSQHNFKEEYKQSILHKLFGKYQLLTRIKSMDLSNTDKKVDVLFKLKNDPNQYRIFGIIDEDGYPHVILAQETPSYTLN